MLTKVEPFEEDFGDNNCSGWYVQGGTWTAANGYLAKTNTGNGAIRMGTTDADGELRFDYRCTDTSTTDFARIRLRSIAPDDFLYVVVKPGSIGLGKKINGVWTNLGTTNVSTTQNQWYTIRAEYDGANATVWRSTAGALETQIVSTSNAQPLTSSLMNFGIYNSVNAGNTYEFDNIRILADDLENSYTFAYNNANELTSMAGPNGTTAFTYDAWGRQATQTLNSVTDTYAYRYGSKLYSVDLGTDSNIDVTFNYGGDQKRRTMTAGGVTTGYNWDAGWNVINEETGSGTLARTYFHNPQRVTRATMAHVEGTSPATGAYNYYTHDHLGSTRALYDATKALVAAYAYTPYGQHYASHGTSSTTHRFTGHDWNPQSGLYFAPHRFYNPELARWLARDPLGKLQGPITYRMMGSEGTSKLIIYEGGAPRKPCMKRFALPGIKGGS